MIIFKTNNILYKLERYYSPSEKKTYAAKLPNALQGTEFDSDLKAFIVNLYYSGRVGCSICTKIYKKVLAIFFLLL
ncbi:hypothetical protein MSIBF_A2950003 [groundwater metagenome]|uniref:Uncharacterized protein n=1 Tax=groundwater metagenome TaxID=717931 RepID=A0A098ED36_9ZZZZ